LTPCFWASFGGEELPVFDAAKNLRFAPDFAIFNYRILTPPFGHHTDGGILNSESFFRGVENG